MKPTEESDEFVVTLNQMADLLAKSKYTKIWEKKLRSLTAKTTLHIDDLRAQITQMYGSMGSINDIYLQLPNGDPDYESTVQFSQLATELYRLASRPSQNPDDDEAIVPMKEQSRRLVIVERPDGIFSIAEEYYYIFEDSGEVISEGWGQLPAEGLFETFVLARQEALTIARSR